MSGTANANEPWRIDPRGFLRLLFDAAVAAALPTAASLAPFLPPPPKDGRTIVVGAGKAGGAMAAAVEAAWPKDAPLRGLVVTRYDSVPPAFAAAQAAGRTRIEVVEAAHPLPDAAGLLAAERIAASVDGLGANDLVLCLMSGGASSLLALPGEGVSIEEKRAINRALLASGAAIDEMNCVRKHLSAVKGGRLAARAAPARVVTLLVSDVPGDSPAVIGSGPTVPDPTTCADALAVLFRYHIEISAALRSSLERGELETPKPGDAAFAGHAVHLVATPQMSLDAAAAVARAHGIAAHILSDRMQGESREVAKVHAALAMQIAARAQPFAPPCVVLSGGETTVTVRPRAAGAPREPPGRGGRASELLLGWAIAMQAYDGAASIDMLAADTDGIDGSERNAGAFAGRTSVARGAELGLPAQAFLDRNDAYSYFDATGDLLVTGPTCTNVNDFRAMLIRG